MEEFENTFAFLPPGTEIWVVPRVYSIDIKGNEATVILSLYVRVCYRGECVSEYTDIGETMLIKSGGEWYFYY